MTPPGVVDDADPLDRRRAPAALPAWLVSVLGILWPATAGPVVAIAGCTAAAAPAARRFGVPRPLVTGAWAIAVVAVGFGVTVGLRSEAVAHHPLTAAQGATVAVTVTPTESPRSEEHTSELQSRGHLV